MRNAECGMRSVKFKKTKEKCLLRNFKLNPAFRTPHSALKNGFTLLEVMVALLIIATSFVVLLHTRNQSVTAADYAKRTTVATLLASERMSEIEQEDFPDTGEDGSNFGDDYPEYRWETTVSDTAYENIKEVKVEVLWGEEGSERSIGLVNYVRKKE